MENFKRNMTDEDINNRLARFKDLEGMNVPIDRDIVSQDAMDVIFARTLMPIIMEDSKNPFGDKSAIVGANGLAMNISILPPNQGPCLHAHNKTFETFVVLEGTITFKIGEPSQEKRITLGKWDTFSCPPGVYRGFVNASSKEKAVLLTTINGDPKERDDVNVPRAITEHLNSEFGEKVVEEFKKVVNLP
jgi:quercetin dioxygenase-like cupin family protein